MHKSELRACAFMVAYFFEVADVVKKNGDETDLKVIWRHPRFNAGFMPVHYQMDPAKGCLQGMLQVVIPGIHFLEAGMLPAKHSREVVNMLPDK
jgi:hypothetical protein